jgi:phosphoribosylanthranilate isomerase
MVWVKLCGMTNAEDAVAAAHAGADAIGMLFAPSKRRITVDQGKEIVRALPKNVEKVGVFCDEGTDAIEEITATVGLTAVQLHGDETPSFAHSLFRSNGTRSKVRVFKTIHMSGRRFGDEASKFCCEGVVDGLLLDAVVPDPSSGRTERGGTGQTFDWQSAAQSLEPLKQGTRIIVAGGLTSTNVAEAMAALQPWGVDVCSGVERAIGKKDPAKMQAFVHAARAARNQERS